MRRIYSAVAAVLLFSAVGALADAAVGVKIGTLGFGAEATVGLGQKTNLRLGMNGASIDLSGLIESDDEDDAENTEEIDLTLELSSAAALLDWHCFDGSFRLTAGAMLNNNEAQLSASVDKRVEIGDSSYNVSSLDGTVSFGDVAPYIGIGFGNAVDEDGRLTFAMDLGVMIQGSPEVELTATASDPAVQDRLNEDLEREAQTIEDDTESITVYPVISLGFAYRF